MKQETKKSNRAPITGRGCTRRAVGSATTTAKGVRSSFPAVRRTWLAVALVMLLAVPGSSLGQDDAGEPVLEDRAGDLEIAAGGVEAPDPGRYQMVDLLSLSIVESAQSVQFVIAVDDVDQEPYILFETGQIFTYFSLGGAEYRVDIFTANFARLMKFDATLQRWAQVSQLELSIDPEVDTFTATVPRQALQDASGAPMHPQVPLQDVRALGAGLFSPDCTMQFIVVQEPCPVTIIDSMPDEGETLGEYTPRLGVEQTGHLRLHSSTPVRASNGDDTTYVFEILLQNWADSPDDVVLSFQGAPSSWDVRIPAADVRIDANSSLRLPVLVSTPFAHKHGAFESFLVEAHSQRDPNAVGRVQLGIRYTEIPQPAGHHDTMWIHSRELTANDPLNQAFLDVFGFTNVYFNAAQEDPNSDQVDVGAGICGGSGTVAPLVHQRTNYCWMIFLEPTLEMGLDFDLNRTGTLTFPVQSTFPLQDAILKGELLYLSRNPADQNQNQNQNQFQMRNNPRTVVLGAFGPSEPATSGVAGSETFEVDFTPYAEADLVPFAPHGASLWLSITLDVGRPPTYVQDFVAAPNLIPGAMLQLPLLEYHDPVDDLFHSLTDVDIEMVSSQEALVNPGEMVLFDMRIVNSGVVNDRFALSLEGPNKEWAEVLGDVVIDVRAGSARQIAIAVRAPLDAMDGDQVDLIFQAQSTKDPDARALVRLLAEVDVEKDHPDQSILVDSTDAELTTRTVPAPFAAALGLLVLLRRRR